jgi:hypothetical protein
MSSSRNAAVVVRNYRAVPDDCARALQLLLKRPVIKEGSPYTAPVDPRRENDGRTYHYSP